MEIVISDNDPSQSYEPPEHLRKFVRVMKTGGIAGFSEGNNIGVNAFLTADHESVFILNNDTVVIEGAVDFLRESLKFNGVGAVGPCMPFLDMPGRIWACGGFINRLTLAVGGLQPLSVAPYEVDYLPGAAILCRSDIWKKIGGLSENYFLAYEEVEFALEVKKLDFKIIADPRAVVLHKVGMSSKQKSEYYYNSIRNRIRFAKYLYGSKIGFLFGSIIMLASARARIFKKIRVKFLIWSEAVRDEYKGAPLDKKALQIIALRYKL
jgi:GT2 family glycosyltransferase